MLPPLWSALQFSVADATYAATPTVRRPVCGHPSFAIGEPSGYGRESSAAFCAGVGSVRTRYTFRGVQPRREHRSSSAQGRLKLPSVHRRRKARHPTTSYRRPEVGAAGRRLRWPSARRLLQQRSHPRGRSTVVGNDWPSLSRFRLPHPKATSGPLPPISAVMQPASSGGCGRPVPTDELNLRNCYRRYFIRIWRGGFACGR